MSQPFESPPPLPELPRDLDGFRVAVDHDRERADIVLDRPPLNVVTMRERDQIRAVFEALDRDPGVRVIVLRGEGKHFSSGGDIRGFLGARVERRRRGALPQAGGGGDPRVLFRRRVRAVARV